MAFWRSNDPMRLFERGNSLWESGKFARADDMYRRAIDSGHPRAAVEAGIKLGIMRKQLGNLSGAEDVLRQAMLVDDSERAPTAAYVLTGVLQARGRHRDAIGVYRRIIDSGHPTMAPMATLSLAELYRYDLTEDERDLELAADLYRRAIDTRDPDIAPKAMTSLAELYAEDDPEAAVELLRKVADSGHLEAAPVARRQLRELQTRMGEQADAAPGPSRRPAAGDSGCFLLLDDDGGVFGLWFEDMMAGDACSADPEQIKKILVDNHLTKLLNASYRSYPDGDRGGYTIEFTE